MKLLPYILFLLPCLTFVQTNNKQLVDNLKFVTDMPYICRDTIITKLSSYCGDEIFWQVVKQKQDIIPFLIDKLSDTTQTTAIVPNFGGTYSVADVAFVALEEIIDGIPTFELLGVKFDENACGYCSYWSHLRKNRKNRKKFQTNVLKWYAKNKPNLVWVTSNEILTCDCAAKHPNNGHFELAK